MYRMRSGLSGKRFCLAAVLLACALSGCSGKSLQPGSTTGYGVYYDPDMLTYIADFNHFPQDLRDYAENVKLPPEIARQQDLAVERFRTRWFQPWGLTKSSVPIKDAAWAEREYAARTGYDRGGRAIPIETRNAVSANAQFHAYPNSSQPGITVCNALMRGMPTDEPFYTSPGKPGQGYPFDNYQMVVLWLGTPVFISHASADNKWLFCETALCSGWVRADQIALVDAAFMQEWRSGALHAVVRDDLSLNEGEAASNGALELRVGSLLPVDGGRVLIPLRDKSGRAVISRTTAPGSWLQPFPLKFTPEAVAELGNQFMGRPYGWGGSFHERDCSLLLRDLFVPFGVWLPRNSRAQLTAGFKSDISMLPPEAKAQWLAENAQPFRTILGMPGHVTLYLGEYRGKGAIYHAIWGLRISTSAGEGRAVLGKTCVTSLLPGQELHNIITGKMLLHRFTTASTLLSGDGR